MVNDFNQLYYQDSYQKEFDAQVLDFLEQHEEKWVHLSQTCFYPLGGGQPGDRGVLILSAGETDEEYIKVLDTRWKENKIWHQVNETIAPGTKVHGIIDFERRFDLMQQHSGEHIISGIVNRHFGYQNVGFHISEKEMTFDFNGMLNDEDILKLEIESNDAILKNIPIKVQIFTHEEQKNLSYRSKLDLKEDVRIVTIDGYDQCACAGTHLRMTSEIGLIKIIRKEKYKTGVRLTVLCGHRAFSYFQKLDGLMTQIGRTLSANLDGIMDSLSKQKEEIDTLKQIIHQKNEEWINLYLESLSQDNQHCILENNNFDKSEWKNIAQKIVRQTEGIVSIITSIEEEKYILFMYSESLDLRSFINPLKDALQFKGGGNQNIIQGPIIGNSAKIRKTLCELS